MWGVGKTPGCFYIPGVTFSLHPSSGRRLHGGKLFASLGWADCLWKEEKKFNLAKKMTKKRSFPVLYFDSLGPTLALSAVVFARYPFFEPWCATQNDPFLTKKGEKVFFGPKGAFLCRNNGMVGVAFSTQYVR